MSHAVEKMAYAGETPWHGLGSKVSPDLTPAEMMVEAGLDWQIEKRKIYLGDNTEIPRKFALVRSTDNRVLDVVGSTYKITQNAEVFEFFNEFVLAGDMKMDVAGSLHGGKYIWALARVGSDFAIGKGSSADEIQTYLLFSNPHVYGYSRVIKWTAVRVVCWNTLNYALGADLSGKRTRGKTFSIPHSVDFGDKQKEAAKKALGLAMAQTKQFEEAVRLLAKVKASKDEVDAFFWHVLGRDRTEAKTLKDGSLRIPTMVSQFHDALDKAPGQDLRSAKGTWWGAVNAVTYVIDHEASRTPDVRLHNAWMGYTADIKTKAMDLALVAAR